MRTHIQLHLKTTKPIVWIFRKASILHCKCKKGRAHDKKVTHLDQCLRLKFPLTYKLIICFTFEFGKLSTTPICMYVFKTTNR